MWHTTRVTTLLGIRYPIFQGPFGGNLSTVQLAALVSNLGGVGGFGAYTLTPQEILTVHTALRKATDGPFNLNLWVSDTDVPGGSVPEAAMEKAKVLFRPYFDELGVEMPAASTSYPTRFENQAEMILHVKPPVFSFIFGIPSATILEECRRSGIVTMGAATTVDEALALESAGVDLIAAAGFEGGGHRPSFLAPAEQSLTGTFVLVQQIRDRVRTPVIAAGGIANARGVAAALALGADGVQIGTAFLACEESGALPIHREMLFSPASRYTVLTRVFTGRLGRGLRSRLSEELRGHEDELLPFPLEAPFLSPLRRQALEQEQWDMLMFWGGQIAPLLKHRKAKELMQSIIEEMNAASTY